MKLNRILILTITLGAAFALPSTTSATKANKSAKGEAKAGKPRKVLKELDKNRDHQIDGDEIEALKKQFLAEPTGPLSRIDRNKNGTLDDDEVKALNARITKRSEGKAGGKKKKTA